jgi:hypothetical protein
MMAPRTGRAARAEAARLYQAGMLPGNVISELGLAVHPSTVVRWAGGAARPGPRGRTDLDNGEIARLRDTERLTWAEISRRVSASRTAVRSHYALATAPGPEEAR